MNLDKRIINGKRPLTCFDTEQAKQYVDSKGYFTNDMGDFKYLNDCYYGTLNVVDNNSSRSYLNKDFSRYFDFFLPEEFVKQKQAKKKYRPYTFEEFNDKYTVGCSIITFRRKAYAELIHNVLFIGYREDKEGLILLLGNAGYSLEELFNEYEYKNSLGKWVPFGKRVEE